MNSTHEPDQSKHRGVNAIIRTFLDTHLSIVLILPAVAVGIAAVLFTPREEDPQVVVPVADVHVSMPGFTAEQVEQLAARPLEKLLHEIDGVEYVYGASRDDGAVITVRFYVGQDRERSLVRIFKRIDEHLDIVPPGVTGWVIKPVEIDDVPIVTVALSSRTADEFTIRRVGEEVVSRLTSLRDLSRVYLVGGSPRVMQVYLDIERMRAYGVSPLEIKRALAGANVELPAGEFALNDQSVPVRAGHVLRNAEDVRDAVVAVTRDRPVFLRDVAEVVDGPAEAASYVRLGFGPAHGFGEAIEGGEHPVAGEVGGDAARNEVSRPAVTIAAAKQRGTDATRVARNVLRQVAELERTVIPDDIDVIVTRNYGETADAKVDELLEGLGVAIVIVIALLTVALGWREAFIVAVAVPVVFGLTLAVNWACGFTINRVTLFALILSLGLLVDDPIVDVENISRHFALRGRRTRDVVLEAVSEIRPPLISATLAVIVSFLPLFFITGMMGPYMRPMALNVPVAMLASMLVAFTITPWLSFHVLGGAPSDGHAAVGEAHASFEATRRTRLYRLFHPLMAPLLRSRVSGFTFLIVTAVLTAAALGLAAVRRVPLKMLPFDNKNELLVVLDFPEGTTLERADAGVRKIEEQLAEIPEVTNFTSYVGVNSPIDFNGMVRQYYLRQLPHFAEIRVNLVSKHHRAEQSHALALAMRDRLQAIATETDAVLKVVETPPGPPVVAGVVVEVYGRPDHSYNDLIAAAETTAARLKREIEVVEVDDTREHPRDRVTFELDHEKAALNGVSAADAAETVRICLAGTAAGLVHEPAERQPLALRLQAPRAARSSEQDLASVAAPGFGGRLVPLAEIGRWSSFPVRQTIYHKNLERVAYVFAEGAGRPPADVVVDVMADRREIEDAGRANAEQVGSGWVGRSEPRSLSKRSFVMNGGGVEWAVPDGIRVEFAGEGEWKITLDVFRDLGLAFAAALVAIYILLFAQTTSFVLPLVVMLAIPLTVLGIMPGFWLLNLIAGNVVNGHSDPVFFTATAMIGMIALSGIVTRDAIILVDFIRQSKEMGRSLFQAVMESRVVRLRPIVLTSATAMLSALPITMDPIFSGLAWALVFGLLASTVFTLFVIPVAYWMLYARREDFAEVRGG